MVWVCTGSFRGVRDQPVTGHEGSIPAGVRHIRRVFGGYSAQLRALGHVPLVLAGLLIAARACGPAPMRSEPEVPVRPAPAVSTMNGRGTVGRPGGVAEAGWEGVVEPEGGEAVHQAPGRGAGQGDVGPAAGGGDGADPAVEGVGAAVARGRDRGVVGVVEVGVVQGRIGL